VGILIDPVKIWKMKPPEVLKKHRCRGRVKRGTERSSLEDCGCGRHDSTPAAAAAEATSGHSRYQVLKARSACLDSAVAEDVT